MELRISRSAVAVPIAAAANFFRFSSFFLKNFYYILSDLCQKISDHLLKYTTLTKIRRKEKKEKKNRNREVHINYRFTSNILWPKLY
jgi:hypothetical protein